MKIIEKCNKCVLDSVSIRGCDEDVPCIIYIDDFPGISKEFLDAIKDDSKHDSYYDLFLTAKKTALMKFNLDFIEEIGKHKSFVREVLKTPKGKPKIALTSYVKTGVYDGVLINLGNSESQVLNLKSFKIFARNSGTVTFKVFSTVTGEIFTKDFVVTVGFNDVKVDEQLRIEFDGDQAVVAITSANVEFYQMNCGGESISCGCLCSVKSEDFTNQSITFDDPWQIPLNAYESKSDSAICFDIVLECDIEQIICNEKKELAMSLAYKIYLELIENQRLSPNFNFLTELNTEYINKEIVPKTKGLYKQALSRATLNLIPRISDNSICFSCMPDSGSGYSISSRGSMYL